MTFVMIGVLRVKVTFTDDWLTSLKSTKVTQMILTLLHKIGCRAKKNSGEQSKIIHTNVLVRTPT